MKNIIDTWAAQKLKQKFEWGVMDCRWLLVEFLQINAQWDVPEEIKKLRGSYKTEAGAYRVDKRMSRPVEDYLRDCGYYQNETKEVRRGDIIKIKDDNGYLPIIYNKVVLVGDPKDNTITQRNIYNLDREYSVFIRGAK